MPRLVNCLRELLRGVGVLLRDQRVEHLDDRHLGAEAVEDRGELGADDAAAEDHEPVRDLRLRQQPGRVDAEVGLSRPGIGGRIGNEPVATIADLKLTSSPPSTAIVFALVNLP